jgi:O-methyltransferase
MRTSTSSRLLRAESLAAPVHRKSSAFYPPQPLLCFHPYIPERLGFLRLMRLVNPELARLLHVTKRYSLLSARNRTTLYREGRAVLRRGVAGDFLEIGVHRGGSAGVLAYLVRGLAHRNLHLFDRWGDLPDPTAQDGHRFDEYRRDRIADKLADLRDNPPLAAARRVIEDLIGFPPERLHYYPGWYSETFGQYSGGPIAFASLDCDYYESVKLALSFIDRHAAPAATVVADDYGSWPGARLAIDDWLETTSRRVRVHRLRTGPVVLRFRD